MGRVIPIRSANSSHGLIHVWRVDDGIQVVHESASGDSYGIFEHFALDQRDDAVAFALQQLPKYGRCKLGEIEQ